MSRDDLKKLFSLHKRPTTKKGRYIYYVQFKNEDGTYKSARSSGQTNKGAAEAWAFKQIHEGKVHTKGNITLRKYTEKWFIDGQCSYMKRREAEGNPIGKTYAKIARGYLDNHILPEIGDTKLSSITRGHIERFKMNLIEKQPANLKEGDEKRGLSTSSINHILTTLNVILKEATAHEDIPRNPAEHVKKLKDTAKSKGILTKDEVKKLFLIERIDTIWGGDFRHYTLNKLAAFTGMRMGEIQGLQLQYVYSDYISVVHSWERKYGLKGTKTGVSRDVPITEEIHKNLEKVISLSPYKEREDLVFWGPDPQAPIDHRSILDMLYGALENIGINKKKREERNITFHSWRHFLNTSMRAIGYPDWKIRLMTGHSTAAMTERYHHPNLEHFDDMRKMQRTIFSN